MTSLIKHRAAPWAIPLMALLLSGPFATTAVAVPPCFDIRVDYLGRVPVGNVNGVQYYRWTYRVTGANCINRRMQHFTMSLCTSTRLAQRCSPCSAARRRHFPFPEPAGSFPRHEKARSRVRVLRVRRVR